MLILLKNNLVCLESVLLLEVLLPTAKHHTVRLALNWHYSCPWTQCHHASQNCQWQ